MGEMTREALASWRFAAEREHPEATHEMKAKTLLSFLDHIGALDKERDFYKGGLDAALLEVTAGDGVRRLYMEQITALKNALTSMEAERDRLREALRIIAAKREGDPAIYASEALAGTP